MIILGLNAYHGDSSASIIVDGELVAAVEEERFTRIKHWAGLPVKSIEFCLKEAGIDINEVDHIAINRDPKANLFKKALFAISKRPSLKLVNNRLKNASKIKNLKKLILQEFGTHKKNHAQIHNIEHHVAHLASTFFVSPYNKASAVSVDGFGDFVGAMWGVGEGNKIEVRNRTFFPHSMGLFYLAFTQYLGFPKYGDEYKVMGLAAYGKPEYMDAMRKIVRTNPDGFELNLDFFIHHSKGVSMTWDNGEPSMEPVFSKKLEELLGPARINGKDIEAKHKNIAASLQKRYEEVFFHMLNQIYENTKCPNLVLAGGCAMNSVANGKIFKNTPFTEVYIQPAAGDAGGAIGVAYYLWNQVFGNQRTFILKKPYLGPEFSDHEIENTLCTEQAEIIKQDCHIEKIEDKGNLCRKVAGYIAQGKVVGWFQGRMEWGPRALGNRSILCDPRRADMKDIMNLKIKRRELFRPFAPSIHIEAISDFFEMSYPDPFMLKVYSIKTEKRKIIPAVTHVDGTGRLQTVSREDNELYWMLIDEFQKITGIPVLLNTSFNENEPIVCRPEEALDCFLRTKMDMLVLNSFIITRLGE